MKVTSGTEPPKPSIEESEAKYVDFSDGSIALKELKKAFKEYAKKPHGGRVGRVGMDGQAPKPVAVGQRDKSHALKTKASDYGITGGPGKFCFERCQKILGLLSMGLYMKEVRVAVGIGEETFAGWIKKGQEQPSGPYFVFARAVEQVSAMVEARHLGNISRAAFSKDSGMTSKERADLAIRFLEKRYPKRWGNRVDITSDDQPLGAAAPTRPTAITLKFVDSKTATPADATTALLGKSSANET